MHTNVYTHTRAFIPCVVDEAHPGVTAKGQVFKLRYSNVRIMCLLDLVHKEVTSYYHFLKPHLLQIPLSQSAGPHLVRHLTLGLSSGLDLRDVSSGPVSGSALGGKAA